MRITRTITFVPFTATYVVKGKREFKEIDGQLYFTSCGEKEVEVFEKLIAEQIAARTKQALKQIVLIETGTSEPWTAKVSMDLDTFVAFGTIESE